jgi:hypothetical protein
LNAAPCLGFIQSEAIIIECLLITSIGSIRRECVDHIIVLGEMHFRRVLKSYAVTRQIQRIGSIKSHAILRGLHRSVVAEECAPGSLGYDWAIRVMSGLAPDSGRRADIPVRQVRANGLMHPRKTAELIDGVGKAICWQLIRIYLHIDV